METKRRWRIKLINLRKKDFPLRIFDFKFTNKKAEREYKSDWFAKVYKDPSLKGLDDKRISTENIRKGLEAVGRFKMYKKFQEESPELKYSFKKVIILENYQDREETPFIYCLEPKAKRKLKVSVENLFKVYEKKMELSGLEMFEYMTEFRKLLLTEAELNHSLTVVSAVWKGTHFSMTLIRKDEIAINDKLKMMMTNFFEKYPIYPKDPSRPEEILPTRLCYVKSEIGSWISQYPNARCHSQLLFHVAAMCQTKKPWLLIHPVKYWRQFQILEKELQIYGKKISQSQLNYNVEKSGCFLLAKVQEDEKTKFYRGWHTGKVSTQGGTYLIALIDDLRKMWIGSRNFFPLHPNHCLLPAMAARCEPLNANLLEYQSMELRELVKQNCRGTIQDWGYLENGLFPVITISNITIH